MVHNASLRGVVTKMGTVRWANRIEHLKERPLSRANERRQTFHMLISVLLPAPQSTSCPAHTSSSPPTSEPSREFDGLQLMSWDGF